MGKISGAFFGDVPSLIRGPSFNCSSISMHSRSHTQLANNRVFFDLLLVCF